MEMGAFAEFQHRDFLVLTGGDVHLIDDNVRVVDPIALGTGRFAKSNRKDGLVDVRTSSEHALHILMLGHMPRKMAKKTLLALFQHTSILQHSGHCEAAAAEHQTSSQKRDFVTSRVPEH
jgi:hypothetical protein